MEHGVVAENHLNRPSRWRDVGLATVLVTLSLALVALLRFPILSNELHTAAKRADFGTVKQGETVRRQLVLQNLHPWQVKVQGFRGGCGCTRGFTKRSIPFILKPLETVEFVAVFDTEGKTGVTRQEISIETDDSQAGTVLVLAGRVLP